MHKDGKTNNAKQVPEKSDVDLERNKETEVIVPQVDPVITKSIPEDYLKLLGELKKKEDEAIQKYSNLVWTRDESAENILRVRKLIKSTREQLQNKLQHAAEKLKLGKGDNLNYEWSIQGKSFVGTLKKG